MPHEELDDELDEKLHDAPRPVREPPRYVALIFGVVAATLEMAVILWLLYCR